MHRWTDTLTFHVCVNRGPRGGVGGRKSTDPPKKRSGERGEEKENL